jgi:hypothetical protein
MTSGTKFQLNDPINKQVLENVGEKALKSRPAHNLMTTLPSYRNSALGLVVTKIVNLLHTG